MSGPSGGNAFLYAAARTLYSLAQDGQAPRVMLRCNKAGVPWVAVTTVSTISLLTFLTASDAASEVFQLFLELTTVSLVVNFTAMSVVFIGWSRALKAQGIKRVGRNSLKGSRWSVFGRKDGNAANHIAEGDIVFPYRAPFATWTQYTCLVLGSTVTIFIGFDIFQPFSVRGFITSYFGLAFYTFMLVFWKVFKRTKLVNPAAVDISAGGTKQQIDETCQIWEDESARVAERERLRSMKAVSRAWNKMWG